MKRIGGETIPTVRCFYQSAHWSLDIAEERTGTADLGRADATKQIISLSPMRDGSSLSLDTGSTEKKTSLPDDTALGWVAGRIENGFFSFVVYLC